MNYGDLLNNLPTNLKKLFRSLEKQRKRSTSLTWSCTFNMVCLNKTYIYNIMKTTFISIHFHLFYLDFLKIYMKGRKKEIFLYVIEEFCYLPSG